MSRRTVFRIVIAAVLLHIGAFLLIGQMRALPKTKHIPPQVFRYKEESYTDPKTGERTVWREIRVSTKLANSAPESQTANQP